MEKVDTKKRRIDYTADAPRELRVTDLAQSHAKEIRALTHIIDNPGKKRSFWQSMPHYMRRRAASHNTNRIPRRILGNTQSAKPTKPKKPSRFHRRRPKNLRDEFARRQRRVQWMETHLWHAKRFHMIEKWGCKLPWCPTDKGERCAYRAQSNHCLLQDQSYIQCMELIAPKRVMIGVLESVLPAGQLIRGSVQEYTDGANALTCTLYQPNKYPCGAITPVEVIFNGNTKEEKHQVWVWCHVTSYATVWELFSQSFNATSEVKENVLQSADGTATLKSLKRELIRFRFNGPQTKEIFGRAIKPIKTDSSAEGAHVWWKDTFADQSDEVTQSLREAFNFRGRRPRGVVACLRARDPRLCMPSIQAYMISLREKKMSICDSTDQNTSDKENKCTNPENMAIDSPVADEDVNFSDDEAERQWLTHPTLPHTSPLWSETVRDVVSHNMMSQQEINAHRSKLLVPGSEMNLGCKENCVPLMFIINSDRSDLIMPSNWGMAFWLAFTYAGARAGGLRDTQMADFHSFLPHYPLDFPDTEVCRREENDLAEELCTKHFKYPPSKRPNFDKLCTNSPFKCDWVSLLNAQEPVVLRDLEILERLNQYLQDKEEQLPREFSLEPQLSAVNLFPVYIFMINRGVPEARAEICLPTSSDITALSEGTGIFGPVSQRYSGKPKARDSTHTTQLSDRLSTCRQIIGYVISGKFSPSRGQGQGNGFITMESLQSYLRTSELIVQWSPHSAKFSHATEDRQPLYEGSAKFGLLCLIRVNNSTQYRFALLNIGQH